MNMRTILDLLHSRRLSDHRFLENKKRIHAQQLVSLLIMVTIVLLPQIFG